MSQNNTSLLNGSTDNLHIWNIPLTEEQIQSYMTTPPTGIEEGILGFWNFNAGEGNTLYDHSENGNHGAIHGATWVENIYGCTDSYADNYNPDANFDDESCVYPENGDYSLSFDGLDDYVNLGSYNSYNLNYLTQSFSLNFDVNITEFTNVPDYIIGTPMYDSNNNRGFRINSNDNNISVHAGGNSTHVEVNSGEIEIDSWYNVTAVFDREADILSLIINGIQVGSASLSAIGTINNIHDINIGAFYASSIDYFTYDQFFNGSVNNLSIWDTSLTENDVIEIMQDNYEIQEGLIGHWKFNAGEGTTLYDHSGNQNHGTIHGAQWDDGNDNVHRIPGEYTTIQAGINASSDGDSVRVSAGMYLENINFNGKNIALIGEDRETTIIDGGGNSAVVTFINFENNSALLKGFSIRNGLGVTMGSGIRVQDASPILDDLIIENNSGSAHGGGLGLQGGNTIVKNSIIRNNSTGTGGGIYCNGSPTFQHLEIIGNSASNDGGGITLSGCSPIMEHITVADNSAPSGKGSGIQLAWSTTANLTNSIIRGDINIYGSATMLASYSNIQDTWSGSGNISADPLFIDPANGDYSLQENSPCIDTGDPNSPLDPDSTIADMGAYPFYHSWGCIDSLATNYDSNANLNDGSCTGYPDNGDYSLSFDGVDDYVDLYHPENFEFGYNDFTIEFIASWEVSSENFEQEIGIHPEYEHAEGGTYLEIGKHAHGNWEKILIRQNIGNKLLIDIMNAGEENGNGGWIEYDLSFEAHEVFRLSIIRQSGEIIVYKNGILIGSGEYINANITNLNPFMKFGSSTHVDYQLFKGTLDGMRIWNTALDSILINSLLFSQLSGNESNLIGYWKFNAGSGSVLYDHSGNGNHGIIHGAQWAGCTDENSCEYLENAVIDDGSCGTYPVDADHDCEGNCVVEIDCNGECGGDAELDNCDTCDNDPNNNCIQDCNGDWGGSAYLDSCGVCSEGNADHDANSDMNLCGVCFEDDSSCCLDETAYNFLEDGICEYHYTIELHAGANLVSFWALPDDNSLDSIFIDLDGVITGLIGEGTAAVPNETLGWVGSLYEIACSKAYWIIVNQDVIWNVAGTELCPCDLEYTIHTGANLISWPSQNDCAIGEAIPDEFEIDISGFIGEGTAAVNLPPWVGSLYEFRPTHGYWLISSSLILNYHWDACSCSGSLSRTFEDDNKIHNEYFSQSTKQAFYFIESIEGIEIGDWVLAYNGDKVIGTRQWKGSIIDIPAMGSDGSNYTEGYMEAGVAPSFKILKGQELIDLEGDIPTWENNQLYMMKSLTEAVALPESFSLDRAYPNPFNPTTTLSFAIPIDSEVSLSIYNLQGREISLLINDNMEAGYHSIVWDANPYASGVYFVKMVAGEYISTQKLMLIK